ncbi:MAG: hypothetical protein AB7Y46_11660 [Armatimonadota bacterium]
MSRSLACWVVVLVCAMGASARTIFTREQFDELDARLDASRDFATATADAFAWGESYAMRGYLEMYRATGDADYLRRLVRVADAIIARRDDRRPEGERPSEHPVWSIDAQFTVARLVLRDDQGRDAILLRSILSGNNDTITVSFVPGERPGTFTLSQASEYWSQHLDCNRTFADLSLDPADERYFPRVINNLDYIPEPDYERIDDPDARPSELLVAVDLRETRTAETRLAPVTDARLVPMSVPYWGYIGPIYGPMTGLARLVSAEPALQAEFGAAADRLAAAATESMDGWERLWREGPGEGQGYYLSIERGGGLWWDGVMAPMNYLAAAGMVLLDLWECRGDQRALDHATCLARLLQSDLELDAGGAYVFHYWPTSAVAMWTRENALSLNTPVYRSSPVPDDLSHGAWSVEFAVRCHQAGVVFSREDMDRFALTFTRNLWRGPNQHLAMRVDGAREGSAGLDIGGTRWLDLCPYEPRIYEMMRTLYHEFDLGRGVYGHALGGYGRMYRWQRELEGR